MGKVYHIEIVYTDKKPIPTSSIQVASSPKPRDYYKNTPTEAVKPVYEGQSINSDNGFLSQKIL